MQKCFIGVEAMKKITCIITCIVFLFAASACQQTPEKEAVVYGRNLMNKIEETSASFSNYDVPPEWQETLEMKGIDEKIMINAEISIPDVAAFPVYKVKQLEFEETIIENLVNYFSRGESVIKDSEPTKSELEKEYILAKKNDEDEMAALIKNQIDDAPEYVEPQVITNWLENDSVAGFFIEEDGLESNIYVSSERFLYMKGFVITNSVLEMNDINADEKIEISEESSIEFANITLKELGIEHMAAYSLEKAQYYGSMDDVFGEADKEKLSKGYLIKFARNIDGITGIINHSSGYHDGEEIHYEAPIYPEEIQVFIDEEGIVRFFTWMYPLEVLECLSANITLLKFDKIKERIKDMLTYINSFNSAAITVTEIKMNMAIIGVENEPDEAMYVPAWFVKYQKIYKDMPEEFRLQESTLLLSAIDGGRIMEFPPIDYP